MDPVTALGVAGTVINLIDFGQGLIKGTLERYNSAKGSSLRHAELESLAEGVLQINLDLKSAYEGKTGPSSSPERALESLSRKCTKVAEELLDILNDLKIRGNNKAWQSFRQAVRSIGKEKQINELFKTLDSIQQGLITCLVAMMKNEQSHTMIALETLSEQHQEMKINNTDNLRGLRNRLIAALQESAKDIKNSVKKSLADLIDAGRESSAAQSILKSLRFDSMSRRYGNIDPAHHKTFEWIFQDTSTSPFPQVKFLDWLRDCNGMYWISGNAGSGKSTLMKYLCDHDSTMKTLQEWADGKMLVVASYFFWISGDDMQRSQEGLLCSLLNEILTKSPDLIPVVARSQWNALMSGGLGPASWSRGELLNAFELLKAQDLIAAKFCFFVDGLDEYSGENHEDVVKLLKDFTEACPNIKICVSSRPWTVFERSLGGNAERMLRLQDLTRDDIKLFVKEKFEDNELFVQLQGENDEFTKETLVLEIVERANGVFLWVALVVKDLLKGLGDEDDLSTLHERLRLLPPNLEKYFSAMLSRIHEAHRRQAAQIFRLALAADSPVTLMTLSYLGESEADPAYAIKAKLNYLTQGQIHERIKLTRTRVKARCSDLMVIVGTSMPALLPVGPQVEFLHRTVRDFLQEEERKEMLEKWLKKSFRPIPTSFDPSIYLCRAFLAQMRLVRRIMRGELSRSQSNNERAMLTLTSFLHQILNYSMGIEKSGGVPDDKVLDEADRVMHSYNDILSSVEIGHEDNRFAKSLLGMRDNPGGYRLHWIRALAIHWGLCSYVRRYIDLEPGLIRGIYGQPALYFALVDTWSGELGLLDTEMVQLLLERGANPNQTCGDLTVWGHLLRLIYDEHAQNTVHTEVFKRRRMAIFESLLRNGADPDLQIQTGKTNPTGGIGGRHRYAVYTKAFDIIALVVSPSELNHLRRVADETRGRGWQSWIPGLKWIMSS